ncbi:hypothetical protein PG994_014034 [Apiospora phragmitis]|uniref:Indoleamine 2,3-dioxygenase n=1 Tax=Apiospora phragmitis TaxID=2905665 RepID=A0ABR1T364_9PEZI
MPFAALEIFHKYTVWYFSRPEPLRKFSTPLRSNTELRKQPEVVHFLRTYDSNTFYGVLATVKFLRDAKTTDPILPRLIDMLTEQCSALLGDYESNVDHWHEIANTYHPPATGKESGSRGALSAAAFSEWNSKGRVVLESMASLVMAEREAHRKQRRHSLLPSTTTLCLWLNPFTGIPDGGEVDGACREYATSLR